MSHATCIAMNPTHSSQGPSSAGEPRQPQPPSLPRERRKRRATVPVSDEHEQERNSKRRTVPDELRKRAGVSCDSCKTRRVRCVRSNPGPRDGPQQPCDNCLKLEVLCQSALPRKTRIYGSVESLSARYRVLEALVKGLLPGEDTNSTDNLMRVAANLNIEVPVGDQATLSAAWQASTGADIHGAVPVASRPAEGSTSRPPQAPAGRGSMSFPNSNGHARTPVASADDGVDNLGPDRRPSHACVIPPHTRAQIPTQKERLYPNSQGVMSYLGPSSSFKFMIRVRKVLADSRKDRSTKEDFLTGPANMAMEGQNPGAMDADEDGRPEPNDRGNEIYQLPNLSQTASPPRAAVHLNDNSTPPMSEGARRGSVASVNDSQGPFATQGVLSRLLKFAKDSLPAREVGDSLVEAFFDRVHPNYVIFHRGMFQLQYESLYPPTEDQDSDSGDSDSIPVDAGWICSILMVFVFGAQALESRDSREAVLVQQRYTKMVQSALYQIVTTTSLSNIQALLLIQLYQHNSGERNAAWMLLGCACRMAIAMGMHRDGATGGFGPIVRELRRRVWWTMYTFEKQLSLTLGRPSAIPDDEEVNVGLPNEGMMDGKTYMPPGLLGNTLRLIAILTSLRRSLVNKGDDSTATGQESSVCPVGLSAETTKLFLSQLDEWFSNLPGNHQLDWNAKGSNHYRAAHLLHLIYYHAKQVLTRSYLLRKMEAENAEADGQAEGDMEAQQNATDTEFTAVCLDAAVSSVSVIKRLWSSHQLDGMAWLDVYYAYHSGIMLLINLLPRARRRGESGSSDHSHRQGMELGLADDTREIVSDLVNILCQVKLCKTMHVFAKVTVQLAKVVGVMASEQPSRDSGLIQQQTQFTHAVPAGQGDNQHSGPPNTSSQALDAHAGHLSPDNRHTDTGLGSHPPDLQHMGTVAAHDEWLGDLTSTEFFSHIQAGRNLFEGMWFEPPPPSAVTYNGDGTGLAEATMATIAPGNGFSDALLSPNDIANTFPFNIATGLN